MQFVPWRLVADWRCFGCGDCCKLYSVVLSFQEWLRIIRNYGIEQTASELNKLLIRRKDNGSCPFLCGFTNASACGLQYMKPKACQLWPFKVLRQPTYGFAEEAAYHYGRFDVFVYVDPMCNGVKYGIPTRAFAHTILREFVEIALGSRRDQHLSTASFGFPKRWTDSMRVDYGIPYARSQL